MRFCTNCGNTVDEGWEFCNACGARMQQEGSAGQEEIRPSATASPAAGPEPLADLPGPSRSGSFPLLLIGGIIVLVLLIAGAGAFVVLSGFTLPFGAAANSTATGSGDTSTAVTSCSGDLTLCSGACVDVTNDPENCGRCGFLVPYGMICRDGQFADPLATPTTPPPPTESPTPTPTTGPCPSGQKLCDGKCTNLLTDNDHCGKCGWDCPKGQICQSGQCLPPDLTPVSTAAPGVTVTEAVSCPGGEIACGNSCVNVFTDKKNCGVCGRTCGEQEICMQGRCGPACSGDKTLCDETCIDLNTDMENCGACGTICRASPPNSLGALCSRGLCIVSGCTTNYGDCNGKGDDGCEVDLRFNDNNCGSCGTRCPSGTKCSLGQCT